MQVSFDIYNKDAVDRLREENPDILPTYSVDSDADLAYNKSQINGAIESAIIQGKSIDHISDDLQKRMESVNRSSAIRTARTATTCAQNAGNLDSFYKAQEMGIATEKQWVCTQDDRTRESHLELDGEHVPLDEEFSNGLQYPGDPSGDPSEVYNCRCTMVAYFPETDESTADEVESEQDYTEWVGEKTDEQKLWSTQGVETSQEENKDYKVIENEVERVPNVISKGAEKAKVEYVGVHEYEKQPTEDQIMEALSRRDKTAGSCASQALAYAGQKDGFAVTDYRGGNSTEYFADKNTILNIGRLNGAKAEFTYRSNTPLEDTWNMLKAVTKGKGNNEKEFILTAGAHTAVVKRTDRSYKYLELQNYDRGWKPLTKTSLKERFYVSKTSKVGSTSIMIDIDSLKNCKEFQDILGYINTSGGGK